MKGMKKPTEPCRHCNSIDWKPIKQHGEVLGYRCNVCGVGVVWAPWFS